MKVCVVGAGAIGGLLGVRLAVSGEEVAPDFHVKFFISSSFLRRFGDAHVTATRPPMLIPVVVL